VRRGKEAVPSSTVFFPVLIILIGSPRAPSLASPRPIFMPYCPCLAYSSCLKEEAA
jgi:hypothetical protein